MAHLRHKWSAMEMDAAEASRTARSVFGKVTASLDWCERNYAVTHYVAEFWNTLSNAVMFFFGLYGVLRSINRGLGLHITLAYAGLMSVGVGSSMFHGSLLWEAQLLDELPMVVANTAFIYALAFERRKSNPVLTALAALTWAIGVCVVYLLYPNPWFHEIAYGASVCFLIVQCAALCRARAKQHPWWSKHMIIAVAYSLAAFAAWNIDNLFCEHLHSTRESLRAKGLWFLCPLLQGHAWWHVWVGMSSQRFLVFLEAADADYNNHPGRLKTYLFGFIKMYDRDVDVKKKSK